VQLLGLGLVALILVPEEEQVELQVCAQLRLGQCLAPGLVEFVVEGEHGVEEGLADLLHLDYNQRTDRLQYRMAEGSLAKGESIINILDKVKTRIEPAASPSPKVFGFPTEFIVKSKSPEKAQPSIAPPAPDVRTR
jgi:hypothetical protein